MRYLSYIYITSKLYHRIDDGQVAEEFEGFEGEFRVTCLKS